MPIQASAIHDSVRAVRARRNQSADTGSCLSPAFWGDDGGQGWDVAAELADARGTAVTARDAGPSPRCCGADPADEQARTAA